jgi:hypothetical protein
MTNVDIDNIIINKYKKIIYDIINHKHTSYWFSGGRGSTKSSFVSLCVPLLMVINKNINALILRKVSVTLKR